VRDLRKGRTLALAMLVTGPLTWYACAPLVELSSISDSPQGWIQVAWSGAPTELEFAGGDTVLAELLGLDAESFVPEALLGGADVRTILKVDAGGAVQAIHTTHAINRQWVEETLPISDTFFLSQTRTFGLPLASPVSTPTENGFDVTDDIAGSCLCGPITIETSCTLSGVRFDRMSSGTLNVSATFVATRDVPAQVLLGFPGLTAGETVSYQFVVPVECRPVDSPAAAGYQRTAVIVAPAGTLPRDLGLQGGSLSRLLQAFGLL